MIQVIDMSSERLDTVFSVIDKINSEDPNTIEINGELKAKELVYGERMSACLNENWPNADEYLQIAVRAQHIKRWHLLRNDFPEGKAGYLKWRKELGIFHAELAKVIMLENGYKEEEAENTANIVRKAKLKHNQDSQTLEDVACLVFMMHYFASFAAKHSEEKIIDIVQKTWRKMSIKGQEVALSLTLPPHLGSLVHRALA